MRSKPILFSAPMVQAILAGRKMMTRRVVKPQPIRKPVECGWVPSGWSIESEPNEYGVKGCDCIEVKCPYEIGDRLWVRETWRGCDEDFPNLSYRADCTGSVIPKGWKPSIFMPRWASRITLEVTDVRVERLQEITEADAIAEGFRATQNERGEGSSATCWFRHLWEKLNGEKHPWSANPWVWIISFTKA